MAKQAVATISLGRTGGVLPDGVYKMRVKAMELKQGQKSAYLACQFTVEGKSSTIFANVMLGENSRWLLEQFLDAVGAPTSGNMTIAKLVQFCRGKALYAKLGNEEYNGRLKNVVAQFLTEEVAQKLIEEQPASTPSDDEDYDDDEDENDADSEEDDDWGDDEDDEDDGDDESVARKDGVPF